MSRILNINMEEDDAADVKRCCQIIASNVSSDDGALSQGVMKRLVRIIQNIDDATTFADQLDHERASFIAVITDPSIIQKDISELP